MKVFFRSLAIVEIVFIFVALTNIILTYAGIIDDEHNILWSSLLTIQALLIVTVIASFAILKFIKFIGLID